MTQHLPVLVDEVMATLAPRPGDVRHSHASLEIASRVLGYTPEVSLEEGIARTIAYFDAFLSRGLGRGRHASVRAM